MGRFKNVGQIHEKDDGTLVYAGEYYRMAGDANEQKRTFVSFVAGTVLLAALVLLSGCIDADNATKSFTVIIPLVGEVCSLFVICWMAGRVIAAKGKLRSYVLQSISEKIPVASKAMVVFALIGLVFSVIYLFRNGAGGEVFKSVLYPIMKVLIASTAVGYDKFFQTIRWVNA